MGLKIGPLHVRRSMFMRASPARVWEEFTSFERVQAWFGIGHQLNVLELEVGGRADFSVDIDGEASHFGGQVLVVDTERELSLESNWQGPSAWPVPTFFTVRLTPVYEGTLVELLHHGFERLGADAADALQSYEQGWDVRHLSALRALAEA